MITKTKLANAIVYATTITIMTANFISVASASSIDDNTLYTQTPNTIANSVKVTNDLANKSSEKWSNLNLSAYTGMTTSVENNSLNHGQWNCPSCTFTTPTESIPEQ